LHARLRLLCNRAPPTSVHTLSLHDASSDLSSRSEGVLIARTSDSGRLPDARDMASHTASVTTCSSSTMTSVGSQPWSAAGSAGRDRKSTRLNSSHVKISYAVFCLKKKNHKN